MPQLKSSIILQSEAWLLMQWQWCGVWPCIGEGFGLRSDGDAGVAMWCGAAAAWEGVWSDVTEGLPQLLVPDDVLPPVRVAELEARPGGAAPGGEEPADAFECKMCGATSADVDDDPAASDDEDAGETNILKTSSKDNNAASIPAQSLSILPTREDAVLTPSDAFRLE
jgi:hypothetical protein